MKTVLYDYVQHWNTYDRIFLYSDPHFGDKQAYEFRKKCFGFALSDDEQVNLINSVVTKRDLLIILGDVGDASYVSKLKAGYKVLVMGNHDAGKNNYKKNNTNNLFDEVYDGKIQIRKDLVLSHEPVEDKYSFNIHGHQHPSLSEESKKTKFQKWAEDDSPFAQYLLSVIGEQPLEKIPKIMLNLQLEFIHNCQAMDFNCCAEMIGYQPVNLGDLVSSGILKQALDIHRAVIDRRSEDESGKQNTVTCAVCGKQFVPSSHIQDVCDKCTIEIGQNILSEGKKEG